MGTPCTGLRPSLKLNVGDVDAFRTKRFAEKTRLGRAPAPATLDKEVELLKRMLNYAERCGKIDRNPIAKASLLRRSNVRRSVIDEEAFARLLAAADEPLRPILLVAYDTGMRKAEILNLRWSAVDLQARTFRLYAEDTKTEEARTIYLTERVLGALRALPRAIADGPVFMNPSTGEAWKEIRFMFRRALRRAGLPTDLWFHDLRRSFVTNARRRGVAESVVMRLSGHKTRAVFDRYNVVEDADVRRAVLLIEAGTAAERSVSPEMDTLRSEPRPENEKAAKTGGFSGTS